MNHVTKSSNLFFGPFLTLVKTSHFHYDETMKSTAQEETIHGSEIYRHPLRR